MLPRGRKRRTKKGARPQTPDPPPTPLSDPPAVICIDDDDDDDDSGSCAYGNTNASLGANEPQIKTEQSDSQWWSVDTTPPSPICISDDDENENSRRPAPQTVFESNPTVKQEDKDTSMLNVESAESAENVNNVENADENTNGPGNCRTSSPENVENPVGAAATMESPRTCVEQYEFPGEFPGELPGELHNNGLAMVENEIDFASLFASPALQPQPDNCSESNLFQIDEQPTEPALEPIFEDEDRETPVSAIKNMVSVADMGPETHSPVLEISPIPPIPSILPEPIVPESFNEVASTLTPASINTEPATQPTPATTNTENTAEPPRLDLLPKQPDPISWPNLHEAIASNSPRMIAEAVAASRSLLANLAPPLRDIESLIEGPGWAYRVEQLRANTEPTRRVLVGVVGRTGVGKSALLNAVLDEDRVLPTNGLRACTAVVTEIAWNAEGGSAPPYRAEIEFVAKETWDKELTRLYRDVEDGGADENNTCTSAEASAAWANIQAVFPWLAASRERLRVNGGVQALRDDAEVNSLLGTTRTIAALQPQQFYALLQRYLDSKPPDAGVPQHQQLQERSLWPLIKVVRVYLKAEALSTGVVLVDLPGFGDANAARDVVAEHYLSQCAALWVVSPITRAVDDKEARALLGRSFRRQLVLDGAYNHITFICSKTDDLSVREVAESLDGAGTVQRLTSEAAALDGKLAHESARLRDMQRTQQESIQQLDSISGRLNALASASWDVLHRRKRAAGVSPARSPKRSRTAGDARENDASEDRTPDREIPLTADGETLTRYRRGNGNDDRNGTPSQWIDMEAELETELHQLMQEKENIKERLTVLHVQKEQVEADCRRLEGERDAQFKERAAVCLQLRNEYARSHVKTDFAEGQREIDEEGDEEEEDGLSGVQQRRSYDEIARDLPVFCVSSRAYQHFCGRSADMGDDQQPQAFRNVAETEIPQLQQHAQHLGADCLLRRDRKILQDAVQLLTSLTVWVTSSVGGFGMQIHLDQDRRQYEMQYLHQAYDELKQNVTNAANQFIDNLRRIMETDVLLKLNYHLKTCAEEAPGVVGSWSGPRKNGGLPYNTYRAICRNGGNQTASRASRSFNEELIGTLLGRIAPAWDAVFGQRVPAALGECQTAIDELIEYFHRKMQNRPILRLCAENAGLEMLLSQEIRSLKVHLRDTLERARDHIDTFRRNANRLPCECVCNAMAPAYMLCAEESGPGCMARMCQTMEDHILNYRTAMFAAVGMTAREQLVAFTEDVLRDMLLSNGEWLVRLYHDCKNMIVGVEVPETTRSARDFVYRLLSQADTAFAPTALLTGGAGGAGGVGGVGGMGAGAMD